MSENWILTKLFILTLFEFLRQNLEFWNWIKNKIHFFVEVEFMDKKLSFGRVCFRVMLLCILNVCSGGFNFFVHSLKFSSRVTKCFVSPAELMCSTDPHPPTLKFRNKNGSNKTRLFLVYLSFQISPKSNDAICDFRFWCPLNFVNQNYFKNTFEKKNWVF